ncbi:tyrosine--tRNA ligase [Candidatus Berkelbacteria bacterium]|nr:tyrosine--tRNA ligase [Candidatus Berkelbacteria bacterium]
MLYLKPVLSEEVSELILTLLRLVINFLEVPVARIPHLPSDLLTRGVDTIIVGDHLTKLLKSGKKLRIKHGVDPTTDRLHIGYAVTYWKLRQFQDLGHTIVFLIGDFTGRFGDPTEKLQQRTLRDKKDVDEAASHYLDQIKGILDLKKTEIRRNSEWYDTMSAEDLLRLMSQTSVAQMLERDMFAERERTGTEIGLHEPVYPLLQGYDSVMLTSDLTVVGTDQLFNELQARPLQERAGQTPQDVMAMSLLIGADGKRKMSQSLKNTIDLATDPLNQFGQVMRIPDNLLLHYFELATLVPNRERQTIQTALERNELSPKDGKRRLAREIVSLYHGEAAARAADEEFTRIFTNRQAPQTMPEHTVPLPAYRLDQLLLKLDLAASRTAAQRLIASGAVRIDGAQMGDWQASITLQDGMVIQVGKRQFRKVRLTT